MVDNFNWMRCAGPAALAILPPTPAAPAPIEAAPRRVPVEIPSSPALTCLRQGRTAAAAGEFEQAVSWFDHALALDAKLGVAHLCRSLCLLELGREDEAAHALHAAVECAPRDPAARVAFARICLGSGMAPIAMGLVGAALEERPDLSNAVQNDPAFASLRDHPMFLQMTGAL